MAAAHSFSETRSHRTRRSDITSSASSTMLAIYMIRSSSSVLNPSHWNAFPTIEVSAANPSGYASTRLYLNVSSLICFCVDLTGPHGEYNAEVEPPTNRAGTTSGSGLLLSPFARSTDSFYSSCPCATLRSSNRQPSMPCDSSKKLSSHPLK